MSYPPILPDVKTSLDCYPYTSLDAYYLQGEDHALAFLKEHLENCDISLRTEILETAQRWVKEVRLTKKTSLKAEGFLHTYPLSSPEGLALMNIAEALLRIPDPATAETLIKDKLSLIDWDKIGYKQPSTLHKLASFALNIGKKTLRLSTEDKISFLPRNVASFLESQGRPLVRHALEFSMQKMAKQFVLAETLEKAFKKTNPFEKKELYFSYDMLGEAARTQKDAEKYFNTYKEALEYLKKNAQNDTPYTQPGISVKLSALHPRYEIAQKERVFEKLFPTLLDLCHLAKEANVSLTLDAEESDRLILSLEILEKLIKEPSLKGWAGLGLAVQAYQKRTLKVLDYLENLTFAQKFPLMIRLVKGAYWDCEIKHAQEKSLTDYPVYTRKNTTDLSYIAGIYKLLQEKGGYFYPQFATHNAYTVAAVLKIHQSLSLSRPFEFQKLYGMGDDLYNLVSKETSVPCRIYAPIGPHRELLPYLIRRLLENGANTSFIHQLEDPEIPVEDLVKDPISVSETWVQAENPNIPLPNHLFPNRLNSKSFDLTYTPHLLYLKKEMNAYYPIHSREISYTLDSTELKNMVDQADKSFSSWANTSVVIRADCFNRAANLLESNMPYFMALCVREAGKTLSDSIAEVREAIDYCRYYALQARQLQDTSLSLPGPTGETNTLSFTPRGTFACISPWNFSLAIFLGEVAAALVTGNTVIAKPSRQTPLIAHEAIKLLYEAGIPKEVLHFAPVSPSLFEETVLRDPRIKGVVFTGSIQTAQNITKTLANRKGPLVPLIAETGGINAMIVDSSALPEHVVQDVLTSAFQSAGQRCSALRMLCLQEEIADPVLSMLTGALKELVVGDPGALSTDMGPIINKKQREALLLYIKKAKKSFPCLYQGKISPSLKGFFVSPHVFEINKVTDLQEEVFGPILHILRYKKEKLAELIENINALGYGLTMGVQSRLDSTIDYIQKHAHVGNLYINRSMIGAVVGVQPFGGEGLSGTGPKVGGPFYLPRFCVERTLTINTTAAGGNTTLLMMKDPE